MSIPTNIKPRPETRQEPQKIEISTPINITSPEDKKSFLATLAVKPEIKPQNDPHIGRVFHVNSPSCGRHIAYVYGVKYNYKLTVMAVAPGRHLPLRQYAYSDVYPIILKIRFVNGHKDKIRLRDLESEIFDEQKELFIKKMKLMVLKHPIQKKPKLSLSSLQPVAAPKTPLEPEESQDYPELYSEPIDDDDQHPPE